MDTLCSVEGFEFDIEKKLEKQIVLQNNFSTGMDSICLKKLCKPYCNLFMNGNCERDVLCPLKHYRFEKTLVCRHWLRGMCRKGDDCDSYHEYDEKKMPLCYFYLKYGHCSNRDCQFIHGEIDNLSRICPYFVKGFCTSGPNCKFKHIKQTLCIRYYFGFCPYGPNCVDGHPKFEIQPNFDAFSQKSALVCHACNEPGHKSTMCPLVQLYKEKARLEGNMKLANLPPGKRPLELVTCFKCRSRGHYANKCPMSMTEIMKNAGTRKEENSEH